MGVLDVGWMGVLEVGVMGVLDNHRKFAKL